MTFLTLARGIAVSVVVVVVGCGEGEQPPNGQGTGYSRADWTVVSDPARGYSVSFPSSWEKATEQLSRISEPRELLSLATAALSWQPTNCEAFAGAAGVGMGSADVVVTVWERRGDRDSAWSDFPPRPEGFAEVGNAEPAGPGCGEPRGTMMHWRNFSDSGRHFHTLVRIGPEATQQAAAEAWGILDRLRLDAGYRPSWPVTG
jgi:hypothetical protein